MKQVAQNDAINLALLHAKGNRKEIEASKYAECFSCCGSFDPKIIDAWKDEWVSAETQNRAARWTALCPHCQKPTVIGSASGLLADQSYMPVIHHFMNENHAPNP